MPHIVYEAEDWVVAKPAASITETVLDNPLRIGRGKHNYNDWRDIDKARLFDCLNRCFQSAAKPTREHDLFAIAHPSLIRNKEDRKKAARFTSAVMEGLMSLSSYICKLSLITCNAVLTQGEL